MYLPFHTPRYLWGRMHRNHDFVCPRFNIWHHSFSSLHQFPKLFRIPQQCQLIMGNHSSISTGKITFYSTVAISCFSKLLFGKDMGILFLQKISLQFRYIDLEFSDYCDLDYIEVFNKYSHGLGSVHKKQRNKRKVHVQN